MPSQLIELDDGTFVEIEVPGNSIEPISGGSADKVNATLEKIKPVLTNACKPILSAWEALDSSLALEQAQIELGIGFEAEGNLYITKAKGNANLVIKLTVKPNKTTA